MAETVVHFLLDGLMNLVIQEADLIAGIKGEVECLHDELRKLQAFLEETCDNHSEILKYYVKKLSTQVSKAEDCIDKFLVEARLHHNKGIKKYLDITFCWKTSNCCAKIRSIRNKLIEIRTDCEYELDCLGYQHPKHSGKQLKKAPVTEEDEVVGFDEEAKIITNRLLVESDDLEVIPIVGMPGLGKTTLATKIFKNSKVELAFFTRIWVYVSQSYSRRDLYLNIISQFTRNTEQYQNEPENKLADVVGSYFLDAKCLIVLDDIWTLEALEDIKKALPKNLKGSRVLLTTRDSSLANPYNNCPHHLKFLTEDECWELLQKKVFRKDECPPDLKELGKNIAKKCGGLPLATLVIAGILTTKGKTKSEWERVHQGVSEHIIRSDILEIEKLVRMSYDSLSYNLKACFLYFGAFPRGSDIPAWKIVRLWVAEGFIVDAKKSTLETLAEEYLEVLVSKNLLMVTKRTSTDQIKTCCMHDMLHEFCTQEASKEDLFKEIKLGVERSFPRKQELATFRRLCIDSSIEEFISSKPHGEGIRSFLCFSSKEIKNELGTIPKSFPLLSVFDIESISFPGFHKKFFQLYHLRYIAVSSNSLAILPKFMENLWNLQTLIIRTQQETLDIQADICKMPRLRHLYTNASAKLCPSAAVKSKKHVFEACALQTLSTIEPEGSTKHVLARCQNLKKLGIRGKKAELVVPFLNASNLKFLEELKLVGKLQLPSENIFPVSLKKVSLSGTMLKWADMVKLEQLPALKVLKLKEHAFTGDYWESKDDSFPCLKVLWIERTNLVTWKASSGVFRSLEKLVLHDLDKLEEVPIELANRSNLQMTKIAVKSVEKIQEREGTVPISVCN